MISIIGFVALIVIAFQVYKSAARTSRNPIGWAAFALLLGIGIQFVFPLMILVGHNLYLEIMRSKAERDFTVSGLIGVINVAAIVLSIVGMWLVARHLTRVSGDVDIEPPPPSFSNDR